VYRLAKRLTDLHVATPMGKPRWNAASVRGILRNPAYTGRALTNRTRVVPARRRKSALLPVGPGASHAPRPAEDWIAVPVPAILSEETFARVQAKLDTNQQTAARNTRHQHLLRALVSCGVCRLSCTVRRTQAGYRYYLCRGRTDALRAAQGKRCTARYIPAEQLDELVWADLCALLTDPAQVAGALVRARGGAWLPQQLQARQTTIRQALAQLERQQQRLLDAYLAEVVGLAELERKRQELDRRRATLATQQRQLDAIAEQRLELRAIADGIQAFCQTVRAGLANGDVRPAAAAGRAAHRPRGRHRRQGRDPLRPAHLTRRPASTLLSVAERPSQLASAACRGGPAPPAAWSRGGWTAST
jgi:site-specific DNA recombinase